MPQYLAFLGMGAIGPDKIHLKFSEKDQGEYQIAMARKREGRR